MLKENTGRLKTKKNASVLLALTGILLLLGCELITNIPAGRPSIENPLEDTWTAITGKNIDTEIEKYDGTFKNEEGTYFIVIDSQKRKIGYGESENQANVGMLPVTEFLANPNNKLSGSAESKLIITIDGSKYTCSKLPADTWTELTVENIDTEIEKYDGTFIGEVEGVPSNSNEIQKFTWILVIIAKNKTMGVLWGTEVQFDPNNFPQIPMTQFMESNAAQKARMIGNGGNTIKIFLPQEDDKPVEVILTKQ